MGAVHGSTSSITSTVSSAGSSSKESGASTGAARGRRSGVVGQSRHCFSMFLISCLRRLSQPWIKPGGGVSGSHTSASGEMSEACTSANVSRSFCVEVVRALIWTRCKSKEVAISSSLTRIAATLLVRFKHQRATGSQRRARSNAKPDSTLLTATRQ